MKQLIEKLKRSDGVIDYRKIAKLPKDILDEIELLTSNCTTFSIQERLYWIINNMEDYNKCPVCNKNIYKFKNITKGYNLCCSRECLKQLEVPKERSLKRKATCIAKYGVDNPCKIEENIIKRKATCIAKYGVDVASKSNIVKNKAKENNLKKYGVESTNQLEEVKHKQDNAKKEKYGSNYRYMQALKAAETMNLRYGEHYFKTELFKEQVKLNNLKKYGVESTNQLEEVKQKSQNTFMLKYGVSHQSQIPEIHEKQQKYKWKKYTLPSGKVINIQGHEDLALDELLKIYSEDEIVTQRKDIPTIWYYTSDGKKHRYYPDIWIPKDNLIIEVKSNWTMNKYLEINLLKEQATKDQGYNFKFFIF